MSHSPAPHSTPSHPLSQDSRPYPPLSQDVPHIARTLRIRFVAGPRLCPGTSSTEDEIHDIPSGSSLSHRSLSLGE